MVRCLFQLGAAEFDPEDNTVPLSGGRGVIRLKQAGGWIPAAAFGSAAGRLV